MVSGVYHGALLERWETLIKVKHTPTLLQTLILTATGLMIFWQLRETAKQNYLDRIISWKNSVQNINTLIINNAALFGEVLYPGRNQKEIERLTAAYASLHALEVIYYMRKEDEYPPYRLREFLVSYVASDAFAELWKFAQYRVAFTQEFQEEINKILMARGPQQPAPDSPSATPPTSLLTPPSTPLSTPPSAV